MTKNFSKLFLRISITSFIGIYCLALAPSALAKNGNGNGKGNGNSNQTSTTNTTTTTTASSATCSLTDVFLGNVSASACQGPFSGNDTGSSSTLLDDLNSGLFNLGVDATWELVGKTDSPDNFGFEATGKNSGSWSLNQALGEGLSTFVISLKTSSAYSTYLFKDVDFAKTGLTGSFNTIGVALDGSGKQGKDLSHASIFRATYVNLPEPAKAKVPEPTATIGLGLVMGGMLINRRRKSHGIQQCRSSQLS
ncbi:PEP-CTERM sorting domain-containing protein [Anabaena sp. 4-3]|uniref:PEP-CTERM sorting domain-containing protein n=1 Tax=Anabaena sp. 4-3 TaxID=1811979 RepID=UPI0009ED0D28|nr:PEP-CTERM sorting domain-containing protein [Anabaena sp. 4-3]